MLSGYQSYYQNLLFSLDNLSVLFGKIRALSSIKLQINRGEILFVTGSSGSGKSTLLRVLSGEIKASEGKFVFYNKGSEALTIAPIFQELRLIEQFSIYDNLQVAFNHRYVSKEEFDNDLFELARIFNITDRLSERVVNLNGGLKQKVAIMRAFLTRADILLADEPTSSLDLENAKKVFEIFHLYNLKKKITVVWTSHSRELVKHFTGRIVHLDSGKLIYSGHACFI